MALRDQIAYLEAEISRYKMAYEIFDRYIESLSDSVSFAPTLTLWIHVYNRKDLEILMQLAPRWEKTYTDRYINYSALVGGERVSLIAKDNALPDTCKLVEQEVIIEETPIKIVALQPRRIEKRLVLKCTEHVSAQSDIL